MITDHWVWRVTQQEEGVTVLSFLRSKLCLGINSPSVKAVKRVIDGKGCTVNRHVERFSSTHLRANDLVCVKKKALIEKDPSSTVTFPTLYEDEDLLICAKPAGVVCEREQFRSLGELVHRLDKETTGALILAKTLTSKQLLIKAFKKREVKKGYLAIVTGRVKKDRGTIDNFLGPLSSYAGQTIYGAVEEKKGERAITFWKCLQRSSSASLLWCEPLTGRTHQLRVHLSQMGHPILGDVQYAPRKLFPLSSRNLLHAYDLRFIHPITGKPIAVVAPIPADFQRALTALKFDLNP